MTRTCVSVLLVLGLAAPPVLARQFGEGQGGPPEYEQALVLLAAGDTATAIERLRVATRSSPNFGPAWLRLGALLSDRAGEVETEFRERVEAERALERAARLMPGEPEVFVEHGLLLRKQNRRQDAVRVLERAWELAERKGQTLAPDVTARMHYALALIYERWWEDWQNLVEVPPGVTGVSCSAVLGPVSQEGAAVACPKEWEEQADLVMHYADLRSEERTRMLQHYRAALAADPGHVGAAVGLMGHLADAGEWEEYHQIARRLVLTAPQDARSHLFLGLGYHERGYGAAADSAFDRALALLSPEDRAVFEDISMLLPGALQRRYVDQDSTGKATIADVFFTARDPLWLTPTNERRLEHYSRLAWAELKFSAPESGLRGWDSDRGRVWVRYGAPTRWHQVGYGTGGRMIFWSYGSNGPVFVFGRQLTYRRARMGEGTRRLVYDLAEDAPEMYRPRTITTVHDIVHQTVRFRGRDPHLTRVDVYAELPLDALAPDPDAAVETGVFVFDAGLEPIWDFRQTMRPELGRLPVTYRYQVPPGYYMQGVEARAVGPDTLARPAARARSSVEAVGYPPGELGISDLLLARSVEPRVETPTEQRDFAIIANPAMAYAVNEPIAFYFELYNLLPDDEHFASYEIEMVVTLHEIDRADRPSLIQALGDLADRWGFTPEGTDPLQIRFAKEAYVLARDLIPEYFQVQIPGSPPGEYELTVRVRDRNADRTVTSSRSFVIVDPVPSPDPVLAPDQR